MKKAIMIFALATGIGVNGFSQQNVGTLPTNILPSTTPANISQLETRVRLITQNFYNVPTPTQTTGNFGTAARWNSMGSLNAGSQVLNGFRTQTNGRGLTLGYSTLGVTTLNPTGTNTNLPSNNPTIQWIGNATGASVTPGNLEFKYALNPGAVNVPALDANIFTMEPRAGLRPSFCYADTNAFVGQKQSGTFGSFGVGDIWSATGQVGTANFTTYGARQQYQGFTVNTALLKDNATNKVNGVLDFGCNTFLPVTDANLTSFKFRIFTNPNLPSTIKNVWQTSVREGNVMMGRQDITAVNAAPFYLSVFDGAPITPPTFPTSPTPALDRAAIYATSSTLDEFGVQVNNYAAIVGDLSSAQPAGGTSSYAILGLERPGIAKFSNNWAGYFVGSVGYTGILTQVSDKKFKTKIQDDNNIVEKLMQLQPKNYYFDNEKYKNMAFSDKLQHGFISQEVEKVFPELIEDAEAPVADNVAKTKTTAYKGINYNAFIPMLVKAIQEQQVKIEKLETALATASKNTFVINDKTNLPAEIENKAFTLSQNTPNPFSEKTTISYTIPSNVKKATLAVFDLTGKMLLQYNLQAGKNTVAINGSTLPAGMYLYSLLADGQEVLSKRMVLTK